MTVVSKSLFNEKIRYFENCLGSDKCSYSLNLNKIISKKKLQTIKNITFNSFLFIIQ